MGDSIQVGVIGCGKFARSVHLPNIAKVSDLRLRATCDIILKRARDEGDMYAADYFTDDPEAIFSDDEIDLCVITTRHDTHAELTIRCFEAGKHVLVEKPMCITPAEADEILTAAAEAGVVYTVGHNRRYSPLSERAVNALVNHPKPWIVGYRMVDQRWDGHWALDPDIGGGRLISEAGHIFDFLCNLLDADPVRIFAQGGAITHPDTPETQDNAVIVLTFDDGSLATCIHGDIGHRDRPKELIEIFANEAVAVIDDFRSLHTFGLDGAADITLETQDKGHLRELELLAAAIAAGEGMPVDGAAAARAMSCTFAALESMRTGTAIELDSSTWRLDAAGLTESKGRPDIPLAGDTSY